MVILGAGELGAAIGGAIKKNGIELVFWDADPAKVPGQMPLKETLAAAHADCLFFCVPSWTMREAIAAVLATGAPDEGAVLVSFAKGMEAATRKTMAELFDEMFPKRPDGKGQPFAVVGGPMLAEEIAAGKGAIAVFASDSRSRGSRAREMCRNIFISSAPSVSGPAAPVLNLRTEFSEDPLGVSLASVLKNVYAVALGVADGLGLSGNEKGWIVSCAIREMTRIGALLGANEEAILGAAGVGDLIATGYSAYSRNHGIGEEIARTGVCDLRGEGIVSLPPLMARIAEANERAGQGSPATLPLLGLIYAIGTECKPARPAFDAFFRESMQ